MNAGGAGQPTRRPTVDRSVDSTIWRSRRPPKSPKWVPGEAASRTADAPISTLRGASASVDARRAAQVVVGLILATLAVLGILFIVVGINKNDQINELKGHGVPVTYVVSKCLGLLGGSGSNAAGYSCQGSYDDRRPARLRKPARGRRTTHQATG